MRLLTVLRGRRKKVELDLEREHRLLILSQTPVWPREETP
jgi:hypothetical protein